VTSVLAMHPIPHIGSANVLKLLISFYRLLIGMSRALQNGLEALRRVPGD
jgi:hypothetical protein